MVPFTAGEFGIVYRARLIRSTLRTTDCEIVAVKTVRGKDMVQLWCKLHIYSYTITLAAS